MHHSLQDMASALLLHFQDCGTHTLWVYEGFTRIWRLLRLSLYHSGFAQLQVCLRMCVSREAAI